MKIGIIQVKVSSDIKANLSFVTKHIQSCIREHAEIIVLNEMWNAPYDNEQILLSYKTHDKCYQLLQEESRKHQIIIIGGTIARKENNKIYNTCHIFENGKHICQYDKMHLFEVNIEGHKLYSESEGDYQDQLQQERQDIYDMGSVFQTKGRHAIHCMTVIGQIEGHVTAPQSQKTTKYEHVIPQLVSIQEDPSIEGLLVILNTVGGDVEAGLALAELISGLRKPSATLVLGGGHSIGIPLAVSARRSFIVPTATMTIHPVRHSGLVLGVPQTMRYFEQMQERITGFVADHSSITAQRFTELMMRTGELVMDVGTVLNGEQAVREGLIDQLGSLSDAMDYLYKEIEGK